MANVPWARVHLFSYFLLSCHNFHLYIKYMIALEYIFF